MEKSSAKLCMMPYLIKKEKKNQFQHGRTQKESLATESKMKNPQDCSCGRKFIFLSIFLKKSTMQLFVFTILRKTCS